MGTQSINAVPARGLKAMSTHPANKVALKRMLGLMSTLHWKARYPWLIRLLEKHEHCKMSALCAILLREGGRQVFAGPFAGMTLPANIAVSGDPKYILGSYEEELHDVLNQIICMAPAHIIDIGAAGGYYAVGLAMKIANTTVTAFEAVEEPHWAQLAELASSNGVSRKIIQRGLCTADELAKSCRPDSFILCDCEGAEEDILQPLVTPALASCTMLVELHEFYRPAVVGTLIGRSLDSDIVKDRLCGALHAAHAEALTWQAAKKPRSGKRHTSGPKESA